MKATKKSICMKFPRNVHALSGIAFLLSVFSLGNDALAGPGSKTERVMVPVTHVYSPLGFDDNDETQFIISGYLPDSCYKSPKAESVINGSKITVEVKATHDISPTTACADIVIPFMEVVTAGVLDRGKYDIMVNRHTPHMQRGAIGVTEAKSPAIDDHIYAGIDYIDRIPETRKVRLVGNIPSPCFELDQVQFISNKLDTYSVLPILKRVSQYCPRVIVPVSYEVEVPTGIKAPQLLLHVRVADGRSVNAFFLNDR